MSLKRDPLEHAVARVDAFELGGPALVIVLELEQPGQIVFACESPADELRLRGWLRRSDVFARLPELLDRLLDDLDEIDAERGEP